MIWLFLTSCVVFAAYILQILIRNYHPESLSETYYILKQKGLGWVFQIAIITSAVSILPVWLQVSETNIQFLAFVSCAGLIFVGAAPAFKLELDGMVHVWSAIISGLSAIIWMICSGLWYMVLIATTISYIISKRFITLLFWLEISAFICIYVSILLL